MSESSLGREFRAELELLVQSLSASISESLLTTDDRIALPPGAAEALASLKEPLPETGCGAAAAIERLLELNAQAAGNTGGPKCFHFIIGGSTPAAMAADLLATAWEAMTYTWVLSPVGVQMELQALDWLKEMFGLPASWHGVMVTGATMANFVGLASARQWWGEELGVDVSAVGLSGLPQMPVFSSGLLHASTLKVLANLGIGWGNAQLFRRDELGRVDLEAMASALVRLDGKPALMVVNAGEPNSGEFDPVDDMIDLARQHNCWVHVDGAFGLFARLSPQTAHFAAGVERADSLTVDGHKWLNVPYDSGYAFVRDQGLMARAFRYSADYLPSADQVRATPGAIGPESSRRARSFAVWATLKAYGRAGHRRLVEHCVDLARHCAELVVNSGDLELLNKAELNIVSFRYNPGGLDERRLNSLNEKLGKAIIDDGRFLVGTSRLGTRTMLRPAFSNWRTRYSDVDEFVAVVRELGRAL